jgi:hemoglobin-like flavoprotein
MGGLYALAKGLTPETMLTKAPQPFSSGNNTFHGSFTTIGSIPFFCCAAINNFCKKNMTPIQIELVQNSWKMVAAKDAQTAGSLLYQQLLGIVPELRWAVSGTAGEEPSRKLLSVINYIIRKLHRADNTLHTVEGLSRRHMHYDVEDEQYIRAGRSLLNILAARLGDKWNADMENAWAICYTTLAETVMTVSRVHAQETECFC